MHVRVPSARADMCEYRPWLTGQFQTFITLDGVNILGSPYDLTVVTLRPDALKCEVRGEARGER